MACKSMKKGIENLDKLLTKPSSTITYGHLLQACENIDQGKQIHQHLISTRFIRETFLQNYLVNMYGKCGSVDCARQVFDQMRKRNVVSWTSIISAYAAKGDYHESLRHFRLMQLEGVAPNKVTLVTVLKACVGNHPTLKLVHACVNECGLDSDVVVGTALVNAYGRSDGVENVKSVFESIDRPDVVLWNALIAAYVGDTLEMILRFRKMQLEGVQPDAVTYTAILSSCARPETLKQGRHIHAAVRDNGFESDGIVSNALVDMYRKCGSLDEAIETFTSTSTKDTITWNSILAACLEHGCFEKALQLYKEMEEETVVTPDGITVSCVLNACAALKNLAEGQRVHESLTELGIPVDGTVGTALVNMYGKCGELAAACETFDELEHNNAATWTVLITAHVEACDSQECINLLRRMLLNGVPPNKVTFLALLNGCVALEEAEVVHSHAAASGYESDVTVSNTIISLYADLGSGKSAEAVFGKMERKDLVSWNTMMKAYGEAGQGDAVERLYRCMQLEGIFPDKFTFVTSLNACNSERFGKVILNHISESQEQPDSTLETAMVNMHVKCGNVEEARRLFESIEHRNVVTWTSIIHAYTETGFSMEVLLLFQTMLLDGVKPNSVTLSTLINWFARLRELTSYTKLVRMLVTESGTEFQLNVSNALLNLYGKTGSLKQARLLFNRMVKRDPLSWSLMISSHAHHGYAKESLLYLDKMKQDGKRPDGATLLRVLTACSHRGLVEDACKQFGYLSSEYGITATMEHYGCVVDILGRAGCMVEARDFITRSGIESSIPAWTSLLAACRAHGNVAEGRVAAEKLLELDPQISAAYVTLANLHCMEGKDSSFEDHNS